ncbi:hypothetical protein K435DRAFT_900212 [Dendrothele bispora CBS 962.96]|uniref:Uncharacterized protein n=1 Tax=Dendrothele bispora (strain CBS 962.96) TaxID=1314807 RepID=A0A4S8LXN4_DENBC|nr:hypothetical protein K435DRAFT_900212 [Dendrothele bispora CBS 962.96]
MELCGRIIFVQFEQHRGGGGGVYTPNPVISHSSIRLETPSVPSLLVLQRTNWNLNRLRYLPLKKFRPDGPVSREQEKGQGITAIIQVEAASPSSTPSGVFGGGSSLPGLSRNNTSNLSLCFYFSSYCVYFGCFWVFNIIFTYDLFCSEVHYLATNANDSSNSSRRDNDNDDVWFRGECLLEFTLTGVVGIVLETSAKPLKVPNRAGSPPVTAAMTGNNSGGGGGGGGLGPGVMYHPEFVDAEEEDFDYIESGEGEGGWGTSTELLYVFLPIASTPASFNSFNQRGAGSPPQWIIEEDETLPNNSNAPYPVASHPYPGAGAGGGGGGMAGGGGGRYYAPSIAGRCLLSWPTQSSSLVLFKLKSKQAEILRFSTHSNLSTAPLLPHYVIDIRFKPPLDVISEKWMLPTNHPRTCPS